MKLPGAVYFFLLIELVFVALIDLRTKKIWNLWTIVNLAFAILCLLFFKEQYKLSWAFFQYPLIIFAVGFGLWLLKIMGAGDVKYLFSFFFLVPTDLHELTFSYLINTTILIGLGVLLYNIGRRFSLFWLAFKTKDKDLFKQFLGSKFSYAPAILLAWIWIGWENKNYVFW